ncbi:MAG: putative primase/helicase [Eubacteriaceae bacterium]|nr:putative primase/helicase [Eubacteriaceae bacterium]MDK2961216.1 putative primase/helicase [Eubacteriaceae bacterium]
MENETNNGIRLNQTDLIDEVTDSEDFELSQFIALEKINPQGLSVLEWAESIGFIFEQKENSAITINGLNITVCVQAIKNMFHNIVMGSETDFAIYNKSGYYEICSALRNKAGYIKMARIIYYLLNYYEGVHLWNSSREQALLTALMREIKTTVHTWNSGEYLTLKNGIFLIGSKMLIPHSPKFYKTYVLPITYRPEAQCLRFLQFIDEITLSDQSLALNLQEQVGYIISNSMKGEKVFFWISDGSSGKSTLGNIIEAMVGTDHISSVTLHDLNSRFGLEPMFGKKLNLANESEVAGLFRTERLKLLCTNDKVTIDRKGQTAITVRPSIKLLFLTNNMPELITDIKYGFERRLHITPFPAKFVGKGADINLTEKLLEEIDGILLWALEGLERLKANKYRFTPCEAIENAKRDFFKNANPILNFFGLYYEKAEPSEQKAILKSSIYQAYEQWATQNYKPRTSKRKFWEQLNQYFENISEPLLIEKRHPGHDYLLNYKEVDESEDNIEVLGL